MTTASFLNIVAASKGKMSVGKICLQKILSGLVGSRGLKDVIMQATGSYCRLRYLDIVSLRGRYPVKGEATRRREGRLRTTYTPVGS